MTRNSGLKWISMALVAALTVSLDAEAQGTKKVRLVGPATGELTTRNPKSLLSYYDGKTIYMTAGTSYEIEMSSLYLNPRVRIYTPKGVIIKTSPEDPRKRKAILSYTPTVSGRYQYRLTTVAQNQLGKYSFQVNKIVKAAPVSNVVVPQKLVFLKASDPQFFNRHNHLQYVNLTAGKTYQFLMISLKFEPRIYLFNPKGEILTTSKLGRGNQRATITYTPKVSGRFRYRLTTEKEKKTGGYSYGIKITKQ